MLRNTLFLLILASLSPLAQAEIYTWKDANGNIQFSDNPPPKGVKSQTVKPKPQSGYAPAEAEAPPAETPPGAPHPGQAGPDGNRNPPPANAPETPIDGTPRPPNGG